MFSPETLDFLSMNKYTNSKEWFAEHKKEYIHKVLEPLTKLAADIGPTISKIDDKIITEPKVDKTISRIYCDMRFARDGFLFRDQMWLSFRRDKHMFPGYPEFFFVMSPTEFFYGCGYYSASTAAMNSMRELILNNDAMFTAALSAFENQNTFNMTGDMYKKSKYHDISERLRQWLDRKSICFEHIAGSITELFDEKLALKICEDYLKMKPVYDFFIYVEQKAKEKKYKDEAGAPLRD